MSDDLQPLLKQIQRDGVEKANAKAREVAEKARQEAQLIVEKAREQAETLRKEAERDAEAFNLRARESLRQAGRDLVLTLRATIDKSFARVLSEDVARLLDDDRLGDLIVEAVKHYLEQQDEVAVLLEPKQAERLRDHLAGRLRKAAGDSEGITIGGEDAVVAGFRLRLENGRIEHDFSAEAIARSLSRLVSPSLAELLRDDAK